MEAPVCGCRTAPTPAAVPAVVDRRWSTGELRQGALEGVVLEAVAAAAGYPAAAVRRAFMLSGRAARDGGHGAGRRGRGARRRAVWQVGRPVRPMLASPGSSLDAALAAPAPR